MSSVARKFSVAEIGVFWDLELCPIPSHLTPASIYDNIKLALSNMGYTGKMSVVAYYLKSLENEEEEFQSAKITLLQRESHHAKRKRMLMDLYLWGIDHPYEPTNLMLISKDISDDLYYVKALQLLRVKENNILFAFPQEPSGSVPVPSSVWLWSSLSTGGSPLNDVSISSQDLTPCKKKIKPQRRATSQADGEASAQKRGKRLKRRATSQADESASVKRQKRLRNQ